MNGFEIFLRVDKKVGHNATAKMMQKLKTSTTYAKSHGMMQEDPFYDKKITFEDVDVPYLTMEELQAVMEKTFRTPVCVVSVTSSSFPVSPVWRIQTPII